jgi:3D (Asp-Asp-Asp) domain-containing protein
MIIAQSFWRKAIITVIAAASFASLYEVTILDSQNAARQAGVREANAPPSPGMQLAFSATAYCKGVTTTSGVAVTTGVAAADPQLLPVGSVIAVDTLEPRYDGIYTVMDTGPSVQGRLLDLYMWSCDEALQFGRKPVHVTVLRFGWNPKATTPSFFDRLLKRPESPPRARPARETD